MSWPDSDSLSGLDDMQKEEIAKATSGTVGLFTGTPGTGKTTSVSAVIRELCKSPWKRTRIAACAPTGKAAVRMTEAFQERAVPIVASTIHRTLAPEFHGGDNWTFRYNESNTLPYDYLIMDESSMTPVSLMYSFLGAVKPGTHVLFVGDPNQLPPVGHGKPFLDFIESRTLPHGHLIKPHRFAGRIARACQEIHAGEPDWETSKEIDLNGDFPENFRHIERSNTLHQMETLKETVKRMLQRGYDKIEGIQVLCAVNDRSPMCRKNLNKALQPIINPDGQKFDDVPFRINDKVMAIDRNKFRPDFFNPDDPEYHHYIANGEIGRVFNVSLGKNSHGKRNKMADAVGVDFQSRTVMFPRSEWKYLTLAFAITTHKSQGSGWPVVISMIDDYGGSNFVCDRSFHYTAISRAEKLCVTIGKKLTMQRHCRRVGIIHRQTFLKEHIQSWAKKESGT